MFQCTQEKSEGVLHAPCVSPFPSVLPLKAFHRIVDSDGAILEPNGQPNHFDTTEGSFKAEIFLDQMPITAQGFIDLANDGFYNGLHFHRVISNFMISSVALKGSETDGRDGWSSTWKHSGRFLMEPSSATSQHAVDGQHWASQLGRQSVLHQHRAQRLPRLVRWSYAVQAPCLR